MSCITTFTGKQFDPVHPDRKLFDVRDIAHALSLTCRGNGHVKVFFSVGQHCVNCAKEAAARGYSRRVILGCLLHDASEAYMSDVPRPFKQALPEYVAAEERLLDMIYEKFLGSTLSDEECRKIRSIDDDMLYFDLRDLLNLPVESPEPDVHIKPKYGFVPFEQVEREYLELYEKYGSE